MSSFSKIKKVIVLKPGEKFTIPPDSTLLSTTGVLTSTGCSVPTPETLNCYGIIFAVADNGTPSKPNTISTIKGFKISNIDYLFSSFINVDAGTGDFTIDLQSKVSSNVSLETMLFEICAGRYATSASRGSSFVIKFKTFPSLMLDAQVIIEQNGAPYTNSAATKVLVPITLISDLVTNSGLPSDACPCGGS